MTIGITVFILYNVTKNLREAINILLQGVPQHISIENVKRGLIGLALAGAVLWLLTMPLVMARFHLFSPVALILNAVLWLPMSISLLSGFGVLTFGTICPPLGH